MVNFSQSSSTVYSTAGTGSLGVEAGDFNGDGFDDLFLTPFNFPLDPTDLPVSVLQNNGGSGFVDVTDAVSGGTIAVVHPRERLVADFNGDGKDDLFVADHGYDVDPFPGHVNTLLLSSGGGLVNGHAGLPGIADFTHSAGVGDIDRDGDLDIVVGNTSGQNDIAPYMLVNNGSGAFTMVSGTIPSQIGNNPASARYTSQELVDLNGDGAADLVLGPENTPTSGDYAQGQILYNDGAGNFHDAGQPFDGPFGTNSCAIDIDGFDINGDGRADLMVTYYDGGTYTGAYTQVLIQNPDGSFSDETAARLPQTNIYGSDFREWTRVADFDGDGDMDVLATYAGDGARAPEIWVNEGGVFNIQALDVPAGEYVDIGDFDGNGSPDLVAYNGFTLTTYLNTAASGTVAGGAGADALNGNGFANTIYAGDGTDTIHGGHGDDLLYGNKETDEIYGDTGDDTIYGGQNNGPLSTGDGTASDGVPRQRDGIEYAFGGSGNDVIYGNYGSDVLRGEDGDDRLFGGQDQDTLFGGNGADILAGNRGDDILSGGAGFDTYRFGAAFQGNDTILDFEAGADRIDVTDPAAVSISSAADGSTLLTYSGGTITVTGIAPAAFDSGWII